MSNPDKSRNNKMAIGALLNDSDSNDDSRVTQSYFRSPADRSWAPDSRSRCQSVQSPPLVRPPPPRRQTEPVTTASVVADIPSSPQYIVQRDYQQLPVASFTACSPLHLSPGRSQSKRNESGRDHRPPYTEEQRMFIWYHRTDLNLPWDQVHERYIQQGFPPRPKGGLLCKFYRILRAWNVPQVRSQIKSPQDGKHDQTGLYGVVQRTDRRYPWMRPEHEKAPMLAQFNEVRSPSVRSASSKHSCPGGADCDCDSDDGFVGTWAGSTLKG